MGVWDTVAGTADHLAGSTDEAVGRLVSDSERVHQRAQEENWTFGQELSGTGRIFVRHLGGSAGEDLESLAWDSPDGGFMGNVDDIDLVGPGITPDAVVDPLVNTPGEDKSILERIIGFVLNNPAKTVAVLLLLYILPALTSLLDIAANLTED